MEKKLNWKIYEITDEEIAKRDTSENLAQLKNDREAEPSLDKPKTLCWTTVPILHNIWGRKWNQAAANFLWSMRPSIIRTTKGEITLDCRLWRITVYLTDDNYINKIEQEVEVGAIGFRNGQDASYYMMEKFESLEKPQANVYINPRAIKKLCENLE